VTVTTHRYTPADPRLGRHVRHDSRSARPEYAIAGLPRSAVKDVSWLRRAPIFDQLQLGSCTFNAGGGLLVTDNSVQPGRPSVTVKADSHGVITAGSHVVDEPFVVKGYSLTTMDDTYPGQYPPTDTGSDALGVMAAMKDLGLVSVYKHAFSLSATAAALQTGPVMWGTVWYNSMFTTDADGFLVVDSSSGVAGGHELVLNKLWAGVGPGGTDVYGGDNSWGLSFGIGGSFKIHAPDLAALLAQQGDICQPTWATAAPVPAVVTAQKFYDQIKASATAGGLK